MRTTHGVFTKCIYIFEREDKFFSDEDIVRVCRLAQADDFIEKFPDKYDTYIEPSIYKLSINATGKGTVTYNANEKGHHFVRTTFFIYLPSEPP